MLLLLTMGVAASALIEMSLTVDAVGTIEQRRVWPVRPRESGLVNEILVATGDTVRLGQVIASLDTIAATEELRRLQNQLRAARQEELRAVVALPISLRVEVEKGRDMDARLLRAHAVMREELVQRSMSANIDSAFRSYIAGTNTRLDLALADIWAAEAGQRSARAALETIGLDSIDLERRRIEVDRLADEVARVVESMERLKIRAPAHGLILTDELHRLVGSHVQSGVSLLEIADTAGWRAVVHIAEREVHNVKVGQPATIEILALERLDGRSLRGRIESVAPQPGQAGAPGAAPMGYRAVLSLEAAQLDSLGISQLRRGYSVRAKIVMRRDLIGALALAYLRDRINRYL
ncbi:MAG: efflux RND transporter periplasmic adaptor subunit [Gemmatimonadaceae bacterium]|nr:efflux RND transporter periplasmic adaptor subunit [Gemmatimonadaceae bacterium]